MISSSNTIFLLKRTKMSGQNSKWVKLAQKMLNNKHFLLHPEKGLFFQGRKLFSVNPVFFPSHRCYVNYSTKNDLPIKTLFPIYSNGSSNFVMGKIA